jgi:hypothetical protein
MTEPEDDGIPIVVDLTAQELVAVQLEDLAEKTRAGQVKGFAVTWDGEARIVQGQAMVDLNLAYQDALDPDTEESPDPDGTN